MRNLLSLLFVSLLIATACNNKPKKTITIKDEEGKTTGSIDVSKAADVANEMDKKIEELKKLNPLTTDQLKLMVPEEFMGMKRSNYSANSGMGTAFCSATYKGEDEKELKVSIWDCAGEAGSGIYAMRFYTLWNFEQSDDNGYQKTIDFNGGKAIEKYSKYNDEYGLTYVASDRLLVALEGQKMGLDGVKQAANNLKLSTN